MPERVNWPAPVLVNVNAPEMMALRFSVAPELTTSKLPLAARTRLSRPVPTPALPPMVRVLVVALLPSRRRSPVAPPAAIAAVLPPRPLRVMLRLVAEPVLIVMADVLLEFQRRSP